jgi:hypothetical protein
MSITASWYDQTERIMLFKFVSSWTWDDFDQAMRAEAEMAASLGAKPYDIIADLTDSHVIPANTGLKNLQRTVDNTPSNWRSTVIVNGNDVLRLLLRSLFFLSPNASHNTHHAKTIDEAFAFIMRDRQSVNA